MKTKTVMLSGLLVSLALAGCLDGGNDAETETGIPPDLASALEDGITTMTEREQLDFIVTDARSHTLIEGDHGIEDSLSIFVEIDLPPEEGGAAADPSTVPMMHLGLFLPDIPECDWDAWIEEEPLHLTYMMSDFPEECQVPIIADAGPYYSTPDDEFKDTLPLFGEGDVPATERGSGRLGEFLISRFVPHGYAVAQVSVFGSGQSNHCFDVFGLGEQLGVAGVVDWLGEQPFSNGNIGLIGRSYDGSTPWMAAKYSGPALKTIVPISGLSGLGDLVTWNGASESRAATFQNFVYGRFGFDSHEIPQDSVNQATCSDWGTAGAHGGSAYATGDDANENVAFWEERRFLPGALENYDGSIYMMHGLLDNNVDPHAGWIAELAMRENGNDVRNMWGQWYHNYPDRISEHGWTCNDDGECGVPGHQNSIRMDWAQDLLEWFDWYLKGEGGQPELHAQIQEFDGPWRIEPVWPPTDADFVEVTLGEGNLHVSSKETDEDAEEAEGDIEETSGETATPHVLDLGVLSETEDVLMGGFSHVTVTATPTGPGGQIYVELRDGTDNHDFGLSYGIMDLRWTTGEFQEVVPGEEMTFDIPLQNFDARLPAGHSLALYVHGDGNDFLQSSVPDPVIVDLAASALHLSTLDRDDSYYYQPPIWWEEDAKGNVIGQKTD